MEADDTFLSELLALLESGDEAQATPDGRTRVAVHKSTRRRARSTSVRTTETLRLLRAEAAKLTQELAQLRGDRSPSHVDAMEHALVERKKRQRAESESDALRDAVYQHTRFVRGLDAVYSIRPRFSLRLNLCRYLHRPVRLPRDRTARWGTFDAATHDARLHSAMDVLCHETASLNGTDDECSAQPPPVDPLFHCEPVDDGGSYSVTATSVYTVDTSDFSSVVRGACVAVRDVVTLCPLGHKLDVAHEIVDADASAARNILYRVIGVTHRNAISGDVIQLESHVLTSYKITDDYAVVLWDFVDDDQLHPTPETTNISREVTGACLVRREVCSDGVERTVVRSLCTKRFRYHDHDVPQKYGCVNLESSYANESLFRRIVQEQVATEEALVGEAQSIIGDETCHQVCGGH